MENEEIIPSIIVAAVAAAGPKGSNEAQWKAKINDVIPHISAMLNDGTRQWRIAEEVLEAQRTDLAGGRAAGDLRLVDRDEHAVGDTLKCRVDLFVCVDVRVAVDDPFSGRT